MLLNKVLQNLHPHVWIVDLKTKTNCFNTGVYIQSTEKQLFVRKTKLYLTVKHYSERQSHPLPALI